MVMLCIRVALGKCLYHGKCTMHTDLLKALWKAGGHIIVAAGMQI